MGKYRDHREKLQRMFSEGTEGVIFYAFSDKQLKEGMKQIGAKSTKELYGTGSGGYYKKTDAPKVRKLMAELNRLEDEYVRTGSVEDIKDMFYTVMADHEYSYTRRLDETYEELGLNPDLILKDKKLLEGLKLALAEYGEEPRRWMETA